VLLCVDPDVPTVPELVGREDVRIPADQPRCDFVHWVMVDIPASVGEIAAGSCSDGFTARGKQQPAGPAGARQGVNDYTGWFAGNADMAGQYLGYDGPYPPFNDERMHRYFFRVFALDVPALSLPEAFTAADVQRAMQGHVLAEAALHGTYTLNPDLK
jgi:Raf kinase inhibitor-like protein, YbhB/YbcL family